RGNGGIVHTEFRRLPGGQAGRSGVLLLYCIEILGENASAERKESDKKDRFHKVPPHVVSVLNLLLILFSFVSLLSTKRALRSGRGIAAGWRLSAVYLTARLTIR